MANRYEPWHCSLICGYTLYPCWIGDQRESTDATRQLLLAAGVAVSDIHGNMYAEQLDQLV